MYLLNTELQNIPLVSYSQHLFFSNVHAVLQIYKLKLFICAKFKQLNSYDANLHLDIMASISVATQSCDHALFL